MEPRPGREAGGARERDLRRRRRRAAAPLRGIQDAIAAPSREGSPLAADPAAAVARFALLVVVNVRVVQLLPIVDLRGDVAQGALIHCGGWLPRT